MEKKNVVFLTVLAIATLLTAVVGTTFAFFTATVTGNDTSHTNTIETVSSLSVVYSDGAAINGENIVPGWHAEKTISVTNTSAVAVSYEIKWDTTGFENTFVQGTGNTDDFVYTLTKKGRDGQADQVIASEVAMPSAGGGVLASGSLVKNDGVDEYVLRIDFKETNINQNENLNKSFAGRLQTYVKTVNPNA